MADILERLRAYIPGENRDAVPDRIAEAADEIERLRAKVSALGKWIPAADVPKSWEGQSAFRANGYDRRPYWTVVPRDFSRDPRHCAGVFFFRVDLPSLALTSNGRGTE